MIKAQEHIIGDPMMRGRVASLIEGLDITKKFVVSIKPFRKKRTLSQNSLYHKWVEILGNHFGYEHEEMADELKRMFLPAEGRKLIKGLDGSAWEHRTTTKLNTKTMTEYLGAISRFAAQNGVLLPHPEDIHAR